MGKADSSEIELQREALKVALFESALRDMQYILGQLPPLDSEMNEAAVKIDPSTVPMGMLKDAETIRFDLVRSEEDESVSMMLTCEWPGASNSFGISANSDGTLGFTLGGAQYELSPLEYAKLSGPHATFIDQTFKCVYYISTALDEGNATVL